MRVTQLSLACCAVEAGTAVNDWDRTHAVPQSDQPALNALVVAGTVTKTNAELVTQAYAELPEPKAVIAFGVCTISGGPYWDSYSVVPGIDELVPVDLHVAGCPPQPADLIAALDQLADRHGGELQ